MCVRHKTQMELVSSKQIKRARRRALQLTKSKNNDIPKNKKILTNVSPVVSCARYANTQSRAGESSKASQQIDRPLPYSVRSIAFNQRNHLLGLVLREQWTYPPGSSSDIVRLQRRIHRKHRGSRTTVDNRRHWPSAKIIA